MGMPCLTQLGCQQSSPAPGGKELASGLLGLPQAAWLLLVYEALSLAWHRGAQLRENKQPQQAFDDAILSLSWVWVWQSPRAGSKIVRSWELEILPKGCFEGPVVRHGLPRGSTWRVL